MRGDSNNRQAGECIFAEINKSGIAGAAFKTPEARMPIRERGFGIPFWLVGEFTTHFRTYYSGDWDVHWGEYELDFDPWPPISDLCLRVSKGRNVGRFFEGYPFCWYHCIGILWYFIFPRLHLDVQPTVVEYTRGYRSANRKFFEQ